MKRSVPVVLSIVLMFSFSRLGRATLGGDGQSPVSDAAQLNATVVTPAANAESKKSNLYSVTELTTDGFKISEFIAADSKTVFAVKWHGIGRPDLSVLLGSYYGDYNTAVAAMPRGQGRAPTEIKTTDISVKLWGRQKNWGGLAFIPGALPKGITPEKLK